MNMIIMRLRGKKGESLIESMAAILIFTFASIIMLTMVTASANINAEAKKAESKYQEQLLIAEKAEGDSLSNPTNAEGKYHIAFSIDGAAPTNVCVDVYAKDSNSLYAYYPQSNTESTEEASGS